MTKEELRSIMLKRLKTFKYKEEESLFVIERLKENIYFKNAEVILSYYPLKTEVDTSSLLKDERVFLPSIENDRMTFRQSNKLTKDKLGFYSPTCGITAEYSSAVILVPMLAFNKEFYRLGRGGGYYDKYLAENKEKLHSIGLAFSVSYAEDIPLEEHDEKLDEIIFRN